MGEKQSSEAEARADSISFLRGLKTPASLRIALFRFENQAQSVAVGGGDACFDADSTEHDGPTTSLPGRPPCASVDLLQMRMGMST